MRNQGIRQMVCLFIILTLLVLPVSANSGTAIGNFSDETSAECSYNSDSSMFEYCVEGMKFELSVPAGIITTEPVTGLKMDAVGAKLYRNGQEVIDPDWTNGVSDPGQYVISFEQNDGKYYRLSFTIIGEVCGFINEYTMPEGFYIQSVTLDGEEIAYTRSHVNLIEDGEYEVSYCDPVNKIFYTLKYTSKHETPTITIEGLIEGKSNSSVTISGVDEDEKIYIRRNNKEIESTDTLTASGNYLITVQNEAGMQSEYEFVLVANNTNAWISLVLGLLLLAAAIAAYMWLTRERTKVR